MRPWAVIAKRRDTRVNQPVGIGFQPQPFEITFGRGFEQYVGTRQQLTILGAVAFLVKIEHHRAFAAVVLPEEQRTIDARLVLVKRANSARAAAAGRLHFDHIRTEAG